ncbi:unnamed protein product, partial [marine sediment metagenome]
MKTTTQPSGRLDEKAFERFFSIKFGEPPIDKLTDEERMAGAIPKLWSMALQREFEAKLWLMKFIGTAPGSAIVRHDELIKQPGDTLYINKLGLLRGEGDLTPITSLSGQEEQLNVDRVAFYPRRKGMAVSWPFILGRRLNFNLRDEAKQLLGIWGSQKVEKMLMACGRNATTHIYSGTATSVNDIKSTDTLSAHDLKRAWAILSGKSVPAALGSE